MVSVSLSVCNYASILYHFRDTVTYLTRMWANTLWANAQRDGHRAKYNWRPLFNATKFG